MSNHTVEYKINTNNKFLFTVLHFIMYVKKTVKNHSELELRDNLTHFDTHFVFIVSKFPELSQQNKKNKHT